MCVYVCVGVCEGDSEKQNERPIRRKAGHLVGLRHRSVLLVVELRLKLRLIGQGEERIDWEQRVRGQDRGEEDEGERSQME